MPISSEDILAIIVKESGLAPAELRPDATLGELNIASLDLVSIAFEIEDQFGLEISADDLRPEMTLGALIEHIQGLSPA